MGSNLVLSVLMVHVGLIRLSETEFSDTTCSKTSAIIPWCFCNGPWLSPLLG